MRSSTWERRHWLWCYQGNTDIWKIQVVTITTPYRICVPVPAAILRRYASFAEYTSRMSRRVL